MVLVLAKRLALVRLGAGDERQVVPKQADIVLRGRGAVGVQLAVNDKSEGR